ncbi:MAG TPA: carboxypeptidase regulatory-like domain-containing protein [Thermoanaerobaculia bacterium]
MIRAIAVLALTALAPLATAIEVRGRIVDAGGKPAARVPVELASYKGETLVRAATDGSGAFRLDAPEAGMYRVVVRAPDAIPMEARLLPLLDAVELAPLRLEKSEPLRVRAQPGARVAARPLRPRPRDGWTDADRGGTADAQGTLLVPRRAGESVEVATPMARARTEASEVTLRDEKPCARQLVVRDAGGAAAKNVRIVTESFVLGTTDDHGAVTATAACGRELFLETAAGPRMRVAPGSSEITLSAPQPIAGRVVDADSRTPIANAFVWSDDDPAGFVRTDAKGAYALARTPSRAAAAGHLASAAGPVFALQPTAGITGVVLDANNRPVGGAELRIREAGASRDALWPEGLPSRTTSGANGAFRLEALPHRSYSVEASHAGFAPSAVVVKEKRSGVEIVLTPGQSAFGKVTDENASPVAAAEVRLTPSTDAPRFLRTVDAEEARVVFTDGEGNFRLENLPRGAFDLEVRAENFAPATMRGVNVDSDRAADVGVIALERGIVLEGLIMDADDRPVAGATVLAYPPSPAGIRGAGVSRLAAAAGEAREATSRGDGRFAITGLRAGETVEVTARKAGFVATTLPQLELPQRDPVTIILEPGSRVSGRVSNEQGEAVVGAVVSVRPSDSALPPGLSGQTITSDAAGAFTLGELPPGKFALAASARGYMAAEARVIDVRKGEQLDDVTLTMRRGSVVEGVVLGPNGAPATGARITVRGRLTPERMLDLEVAGSVRTDGEGRYRMEGVSPGPQTIVANDDRYARASREVTVQAGTNRVDFRLTEGATLSGRVVDGSGAPVSGANISLGVARAEISDASGAFRFAALESGNYSLVARKDGYSSARQDVQLAGRPVEGVELRLQQGGGVITGRINGLAPALVAQLQVRAMEVPLRSMDGIREGRAEAQGTYRIEGVRPGTWSVTARHTSGREARREVTISEGAGPAQADLDFGGGVTLSGSVRRAGQPVAGASVQAGGSTAVTDGAGFFQLDGLTAGQHTLTVTVAATGVRHTRPVSLTADQQLDIDLPTARVSGVVVDELTRAPLAGVVVSAGTARTTSNGDGTFTLTDLPRGTHRLTALSADVTVEVVSDDAAVEGMVIAVRQQ